MLCPIPNGMTGTTELHYELVLRITGHKGESLVYSLSRWVTFFPNVIVTSLETSETGIVYEGIDQGIMVYGSNLLHNTTCLFINPLTGEAFFTHLAKEIVPLTQALCPFDLN